MLSRLIISGTERKACECVPDALATCMLLSVIPFVDSALHEPLILMYSVFIPQAKGPSDSPYIFGKSSVPACRLPLECESRHLTSC